MAASVVGRISYIRESLFAIASALEIFLTRSWHREDSERDVGDVGPVAR